VTRIAGKSFIKSSNIFLTDTHKARSSQQKKFERSEGIGS